MIRGLILLLHLSEFVDHLFSSLNQLFVSHFSLHFYNVDVFLSFQGLVLSLVHSVTYISLSLSLASARARRCHIC